MHSICIPGVPPVDTELFSPLIDHPLFQRLRERKQLGINAIVFPGAVHTRMEHALGVLSLTQRLCRIHGIGGQDAVKLQLFALLHDIGHGPFSHQVESVLPGNHHQNGIRLLQQLDPLLQSHYRVSAADLVRMFNGEDPLACYVSDRNLGTDKLDYLSRDALHIGFHGTPDIERIQYATLLTVDGLAVEEKFSEDAKMLQRFYSYLHQHGYLNKTALAAQRMLQRAMQETILASPALSCDALWDMRDDELLFFLQNSPSELARGGLKKLRSRQLHKTFLVLKPTGYGYVEREAQKPMEVREFSRAELKAFCDKYADLQKLRQLEDQLAEQCDLPQGSILFAAMPYFKKILPKDMRVFSQGGHESYWLFEKDTDHRKALESDYLRTFAIRLVAPGDVREKLACSATELLPTMGFSS